MSSARPVLGETGQDQAVAGRGRALVVLAHPEPLSLNAELAWLAVETLAAEGYRTELSDLYRAGFDPREDGSHYRTRLRSDFFDVQAEQRHAAGHGSLPNDVAREIDRVEAADLIVFQFPIWWFSAPAMMKGWVERVLVYGRTYTSAARYDRGHLRGRRALASVTTGGAETTFAFNGRNGDIDLLLWPFHMSLHYVGLDVLPPFTAFGIGDDSTVRANAKTGLVSHLAKLQAMAPLPFNSWGDWDEAGQLRPGVDSHSAFMRSCR